MELYGMVVELKNETALVKSMRQAGCGNCGSCGGCAPQEVSVEAINRIGAQVGQEVKVESSSRNVLAAAFLVYILPLISLLLGFYVGGQTAKAIGQADREDLLGVLFGAVLFVLTFLVVRLIDRRLMGKNWLEFEITEIIGK